MWCANASVSLTVFKSLQLFKMAEGQVLKKRWVSCEIITLHLWHWNYAIVEGLWLHMTNCFSQKLRVMLTSSSFSFCIRILNLLVLSCPCEQLAAINNSLCFLFPKFTWYFLSCDTFLQFCDEVEWKAWHLSVSGNSVLWSYISSRQEAHKMKNRRKW